ncbi:MAG: DUF2384 domain-containing protein [Pseudomonadota bacterium]
MQTHSSNTSPTDNTQHLQKIELAMAIMATLDNWKLSGDEILNVLALPKKVKVRHLGQFRKENPLPDTPEVNERIRHIIGITKALRTSYPMNPHMAKFWLNQKTKRFNNQTPLQVITANGLEGLVDIRKHLDCTYDWFSDNN